MRINKNHLLTFIALFAVLPYSHQDPESTCKLACPREADSTDVVFPERVADIFDPFTQDELESIASYAREELGLLPDIPEDTCFGKYLYAVDFYHDSKATVLKSLDDEAAYKGRYAKAVVFDLETEATAKLVEYKIGPIASFPLPSNTPIVVLRWPGNYGNKTFLPATLRPVSMIERGLMEPLLEETFQKLQNLLMVSYGVNDGSAFAWGDSSPRGFSNNTRQTWIWFMWNLEGFYANPIGLEFLVNHKALDPAKWTILQISYNEIPFKSADDLVKQFNQGKVPIINYPKPQGTPEAPLWSSLRRRGAIRPLDTRAPPKIIQESGPRFVVQGHQVHWLSWDFHIGYELIAGIRFNDIRFRGERIIYELALQDAYALYGGYAAMQAQSQYNDAGWGMGWCSRTLVPGVDCPPFATFLDIDYFVEGYIGHGSRSICVWEQPDSIAIMRHYDGYGDGFNFAGGWPRTALIIRFASQVYNYDYIYDYIFYADGSIKVQQTASGYLQSAFYPTTTDGRKREKPFQRPIKTFTAGNIHNHMYGYKVDFDILGPSNSLMRKEVKVKAFTLPWIFDDRSKEAKKGLPMMYIDQERVDREGKDSCYNVDPSQPTSFLFVKEGVSGQNQWGMPRAYGIQLGHTIIQSVKSAPWLGSNEWTKYNVAVTVRKDSEMKSGYPWYEMQGAANPIVNFDSYINGESLVNKDLVAWVMVGSVHIPSAEDVPVTPTVHSSNEFFIRPINYFDESPVTDLYPQVFVTGEELLPDSTEENIDTVNSVLEDRCFDGTPYEVFTGGF